MSLDAPWRAPSARLETTKQVWFPACLGLAVYFPIHLLLAIFCHDHKLPVTVMHAPEPFLRPVHKALSPRGLLRATDTVTRPPWPPQRTPRPGWRRPLGPQPLPRENSARHPCLSPAAVRSVFSAQLCAPPSAKHRLWVALCGHSAQMSQNQRQWPVAAESAAGPMLSAHAMRGSPSRLCLKQRCRHSLGSERLEGKGVCL